jgi:hypothetical protein
MAKQPPHQVHIDTMNAYDMADRNTPRDKIGRASYGMGSGTGMPRTPAQQASVKKAAAKSAAVRGMAAGAARSPNAPATPGPGIATGGLALAKPKKGLLSL